MRIVHLMAPPFYGGPERQMLGLARHLPVDVKSFFLCFAERGLAQVFLDEVQRHGHEGKLLQHNTPHFLDCIREIAVELRRWQADLVCCSGYKPDLLGWRAARRIGIPVLSISHGWTGATWRVRCYEALDRLILRWMDAVVCVSRAQADKVRRAWVPEKKIVVIQNAIGAEAFVEPGKEVREEMLSWFTRAPRWLIGAAGRLSPEKGFDVLVEAAAQVTRQYPDSGFLLFGDGPLREDLQRLISNRGLQEHFILAGFRKDLHRFLPNLDLAVLSSYTEGLPVILLEAGAAGVPSVATAVGGIPEVIEEGCNGLLAPPGQPARLAQRILEMLVDDDKRRKMGVAARARVHQFFSCAAMAQQYHLLFQNLMNQHARALPILVHQKEASGYRMENRQSDDAS